MPRHCPRCGKPTAIVVTAKQHATELGAVVEQEWRCEDCFKHFKIHSLIWDVFWMFAAVCFLFAGIGVAAGLVSAQENQRTAIILLLLAMGSAAGIYSATCLRTRLRAALVK